MKALSRAATARIEKKYPPLVVQELTDLETTLGGRQELVGLLALAPLTPDLKYILGMLGDPTHQGRSLAEICAVGNILPGELLKQLASAAILRGKVQASRLVGQGIAAVAEDVMRRAAPYEEACHDCRGTGTITPDPTPAIPNPTPGPCDTCQGTGRLRYQPDLERQKLAIDMAQLLPKSGGINIAQINAQAPAGGGGGTTIDALQRLTDRILYGNGIGGRDDVEEGELVDAPADGAETAGADAPVDGAEAADGPDAG